MQASHAQCSCLGQSEIIIIIKILTIVNTSQLYVCNSNTVMPSIGPEVVSCMKAPCGRISLGDNLGLVLFVYFVLCICHLWVFWCVFDFVVLGYYLGLQSVLKVV